MKVCRGPFNVNCTTAREPQSVMAEMLKSLEMNRVSYQRVGSYGLKCHKNTVRFEMEINHMQDLDNIFVVKFKRLAGEMPQYKEISGRVLQNMNLSLP